MFMRLVILFTVVPFIELTLLLRINDSIGFVPTIGIILVTGVVGAYLAKSQGRIIISRIRQDMSMGIMPANDLLNGLCVLIGGALLLTPGILTDVVGFILVFPVTREAIKIILKDKIEKMIEEGRIYYY